MDQLPKEILIDIFAYLNFEDLCELTSTCKSFNEIISDCSSLMDKFCLRYTKSIDINIDVIIKRKYRRIKIFFVDESLMKYFECFGDNICVLRIECNQFAMKDFRRILILCPNVKKIDIYIYKLNYSDEDLTEPVMKLTLDLLWICTHDENIFKFLQIATKTIRVYANYHIAMPTKALVDFLSEQRQLKVLHLGTYRTWNKLFDDDSLANVDFQLETLSVEYHFYNNLNFDNFKKFLINQKSLREFRVDKNDAITPFDCNYVHIVRDFENVKELEIPGPCDDLQPMPYIEKLTMNIIRQVKVNPNFHDLFPKLNDLSIYSRYKIKFVKEITEHTSKDFGEIKISENVKTLTLNEIDFENESLFDDDVDIRIENLTIYCCENINWLIDCFKNDRIKFKSLKIDRTNMKKSQREYLESLTRGENKKIEKLKICNLMELNENHDYVNDYHMEDDHSDDVKILKVE